MRLASQKSDDEENDRVGKNSPYKFVVGLRSQTGRFFTPDSGESWHIFERFGKSIIPGHVVIVTVEAATIPARLFDKVLIK